MATGVTDLSVETDTFTDSTTARVAVTRTNGLRIRSPHAADLPRDLHVALLLWLGIDEDTAIETAAAVTR